MATIHGPSTTTGTTTGTTTTPARTRGSTSRRDAGALPRWISIAFGAWLFLSAFLWPHSESSQTNTWIVGLLIAAVGVWGLFNSKVRWVNTALAVWLFISTLVIPHVTSGTIWNNIIVAIGVFIASLVPGMMHRTSTGHSRRVAHA